MSLKDYKEMEERCSSCSYCKWIPFDKVQNARFSQNCPSVGFYAFNTYSARGRFQFGLAINNNEQPLTEGMTNIVHDCLACGACDVSCKICRYNLEPLEHNVTLKAEIVKQGGILSSQKEVMENLKKEQTMLSGKKKVDRAQWLEGMTVKNVMKDNCEVLFFPGCKYSYDTKLQPMARDMLKLLEDAGADVGVLGEYDVCCAGRAWQQGLETDFNNRSNATIKMLQSTKIKTIVTPCSDCYHSFKRLYAQRGLDFEVLHVVEYLERLINEGKLKLSNSLDMTVTYHDPCHLGRQGEPYIPWNGKEKKILNQVHTWEPRRPRYNGAYGIYDAPRNVIKAIPGVKLIEMTRIREYSWCCGAGGGCGETAPEFSRWTANERLTEAESTGADAIVTACPWCENTLGSAVGEDGKPLPVIDIFELVRRSMEGGK